MSWIFALLIFNPVIFSKLFVKQIFLSSFPYDRWQGFRLLCEGCLMSKGLSVQKYYDDPWIQKNTCPENLFSSCQQCYAVSEIDLCTTVSRIIYCFGCRKWELQKAAAHKQQCTKHSGRGFTVLKNLEDTCPSQLKSMLLILSHCSLTACDELVVLTDLPSMCWPHKPVLEID